MLRAVETFWEIFRICKTPGFLQHSWRLSIGDSYEEDIFISDLISLKVFARDQGGYRPENRA